MPRTVQLLLTENVDNLGIVGDVVNVRLGYARNFLLPRGLATEPSEDRLKELATKRAEAERMLAEQRKQREGMIQKLDGLELTLQRACNDQGILYGSVTQQDIADALEVAGFHVKPREVRLAHTIKRLDTYEVTVKLDADLEAIVKLWIVADRELDLEDDREEMEFDDEGNLIEKPAKGAKGAKGAKAADDAQQPAQAQDAAQG